MMIVKDYSYYSSFELKRSRRFVGKKTLFMLFLFVLIIFFAFIKSFIFNVKEDVLSAEIISPLASKSSSDTPTPTVSQKQNSESLENVVSAVLSGTKGEYGIGIVNLKTGEQYFLEEHTKFESASLYKLWIMAVVYKKIEEGSLSQDKILTQDIKILNEKFKINEELAEKKEGTVSLSVKDDLKLMITRSDNYAALLLAANVRLSNVQNFLNDYGLTESKVGTVTDPPTITAYDTVLFFIKLYNGEFSTVAFTNEMTTLLKGQVLNEKIPKYLPANTVIGHKTGELGQYSHDGGIVYAPFGDYIIVVLSKSSSPKDANEIIAQISKGVYEYFVP